MKKTLLLILGITLIYSCTTSSDSNGNTNTIVLPVNPSNLIGTSDSATHINLSWVDNSTNETGFKIERKTGAGTFAVVGTTLADITTFNDIGLTSGSTYTYRVYSYNSAGSSLTYSNEFTISALILPTISTSLITITNYDAVSAGGNVTSSGGGNIISVGVVWSTSPNPTIDLVTKTNNGTTLGVFTSVITNLIPNIVYHIRAYATNSLGTAYGDDITFNTTLSYTLNISPVMTNKCISCHAGGNQYPNLETYAEVKDAAQNGQLLCRLTALCGNLMPQDGALPQATISMINSWINANYPQ